MSNLVELCQIMRTLIIEYRRLELYNFFIRYERRKSMAKCICCEMSGAQYEHFDGGYVCDNCVGSYFTCPDCGRVFDRDDYVHGDAGNGFCAECAADH